MRGLRTLCGHTCQHVPVASEALCQPRVVMTQAVAGCTVRTCRPPGIDFRLELIPAGLFFCQRSWSPDLDVHGCTGCAPLTLPNQLVISALDHEH